MTFTGWNGRVYSLPTWITLGLVSFLLVGWGVLGAPNAQAQIDIEQVETISSEIDGVTQSQLAVEQSGEGCGTEGSECEGLEDRVRGLPGSTPIPQSSGSGNSAAIAQVGDNNDATIRQVGSENEASITQTGNQNRARVTQEPFEGLPGRENLAVIVQNGFSNTTIVQQQGQDHIAGIRFKGDENNLAIAQRGSGNEYFLDFRGSNLGSSSSTGSHQVAQIGSDNKIAQVGTGRVPFNIEQRGDGMRMVIRHHGL